MTCRTDPHRVRARMALAALCLTALLAACARPAAPTPAASAPRGLVLNTSPPAIGVLYRLSPSDVELAILLAIGTPPEVPSLAPGQAITDDVLPAVLGGAPGGRRGDAPWRFESREPGLIHARYDRGDVGILVAIMFDEQLVMLRIMESRNLGQTEERIHARAFGYLAELDARIRRNIEAVAQRNWYGTPVPASR